MTRPDSIDGMRLHLRPETFRQFRYAQLLLTLSAAKEQKRFLDLEKIAVVDFLAANPFLVFSPDSDIGDELELLGFGVHSVSYASPGHRFASRRGRISADLAYLVAVGLVDVQIAGGFRTVSITSFGLQAGVNLVSAYADAYRRSAALIVSEVARLTPQGLYKKLEQWLQADPILFDLVDTNVPAEVVAPTFTTWMERHE